MPSAAPHSGSRRALRASSLAVVEWAALSALALACGCAGVTPAAQQSDEFAAYDGTYHAAVLPLPVRGLQAGAADLAGAIERLALRSGAPVRGDGRLASLAQSQAHQAGELRRQAAELGLFESELSSRRMERASGETWTQQLTRELPPLLRELRPTHYGLFVSGGAARQAQLVLARRSLRLEPVPRSVEAGQKVRLRGELTGGLRDPRWSVESETEARVFPAGSGPEFDVVVALPREGRYRVELLARDDAGPLRVAVLELFAGMEPGDDGERPLAAGSADGVRRSLAASVAALRSERGLSPLRGQSELQVLAEHAAATVGEHGPVIDQRALVAEARRMGVDGGMLLPVVLRGRPAALPGRLAGDPVSLAKLGNERVTHLAIGVAPMDSHDVACVLLFSRMPGAIGSELAPAELLARLNRGREARNAAPLKPDAVLSNVAAATAAGFFEHPERDQQRAVALANRQLERQSLRYARVQVLLIVVASVDEAAALEPVLASDADVVGVGAAQGTRPDTGPRAIAVSVVLAWER